MNEDLPKLESAEPEELIEGSNSGPEAVISKDQSAAAGATPGSTSSRPPPLGRVDRERATGDPTPVTEQLPHPATETASHSESDRATFLQEEEI